MRGWRCVPRIALCMLLLGCGAGKEETAAEELLQSYRDMSFCAMEAEVRCDGGDGTVWDFSLRCEYDPEGTTTVEVLSPETAAGVVAEIEGEDLTLRYRDLCLGAGTVSPEKLSPMQCLPELMAALRKGWLLAESREEVEGEPCLRLCLDRTGPEGGKIVSTLCLREEDGTPVCGEIAVEGEVLMKAAFTDFTFEKTCDTVEENTDGRRE